MKPYFIHFNIDPTITVPHISPLMGGRQQCEAGYTYGPVMRQYYIIEYVLSGKGEYTVNGEAYQVKTGEAFIIKPYEVHILRADKEEPWEYVWIGFSTDLTIPKQFEENYVIDASLISDDFLRLVADGGESFTKAEYATAVFSMFSKLYANENYSEEKTQNAMDLAEAIIKKEFASITVNSLAERLFLDRSYFGASFKKHTGKTPKEYIDECRMASATMLMHELGYTVTQAAAAVGYSDVMAFSKMFKKHYGKSPRDFLKSKTEVKYRSTFHIK
ncbi:MAG: helix-turn-helix domain-containing protein [Clostridia bacterium]|nr:helix-turn-helix domain-containing protein [Clostridia bacterium]